MRILFLANRLDGNGGIAKYNNQFLGALREMNQEFSVAELKESNLIYKLLFVVRIITEFFRFKPEIIFCGHINFSPISLFFKKIFDTDYIIIIHGIDAWNIKNQLKINSLRAAKKIISVSEYTRDKVSEKIPEIKKIISVIPNTINGDEFFPKERGNNPLLKIYNLSSESKVILTVGRLSAAERYKGYDKVIECLPSVIKQFPQIKYFLVGSGDDISRIKQLVSRLNLKKYVVLTGYVSPAELINHYNLCDVFVMPSKGEGFGIVYLEALACGKPVIAGDKDASCEPLLHGELGILLDPDNIELISRTIISVLKGDVSKKLLDSHHLRKRVLETYGIDRYKEKIRNLINELSR